MLKILPIFIKTFKNIVKDFFKKAKMANFTKDGHTDRDIQFVGCERESEWKNSFRAFYSAKWYDAGVGKFLLFSFLSDKRWRNYAVNFEQIVANISFNQCDQRGLLLFQYLAIYNNEIFSINQTDKSIYLH